MKLLVACEFSGIVRDAFIERGHDAVSCDLLLSEKPGPHYQGDVFDIINDGWDMMIAHPPCTYLSSAGLHWNNKRSDRKRKTIDACLFVKALMESNINKIAIENPVGYLNTHWKKPTQIINPFQFGEAYLKKTALWLKNLPKLVFYNNDNVFGTNQIVNPEFYFISSGSNYKGKLSTSNEKRNQKDRSKTFRGIANAMAEQWGD